MYESANGHMTVTSQQSALPFCQGMRESPSGRFPSGYYYYYAKTTQLIITKPGGKVACGPRKKPLDFGDNPDHIAVELWLEYGYG